MRKISPDGKAIIVDKMIEWKEINRSSSSPSEVS